MHMCQLAKPSWHMCIASSAKADVSMVVPLAWFDCACNECRTHQHLSVLASDFIVPYECTVRIAGPQSQLAKLECRPISDVCRAVLRL